MASIKDLVPSKIFEVIDRAGISTSKQIILLSVWDIKKLTNLHINDIILLKNVVAECSCPTSVTCDELHLGENQNVKITTGCVSINKFLNGGFRRATLTEIYGESGSGKTQIALQATAHNWHMGCVYICTEDLFPVKRFEQLKRSIPAYNFGTDYGKNILVEHITEAHELLSCVRVRLPKLLETINLSIIIIDSVAAPFRSEYTNYIQRAEDLRELAVSLLKVAQSHNLAVLCLNQVTASFSSSDNVLPSLGLAWSNMVSTRLWLKKTGDIMRISNQPEADQNIVYVRELQISFAPDLPNVVTKFLITPTGIQGLK